MKTSKPDSQRIHLPIAQALVILLLAGTVALRASPAEPQTPAVRSSTGAAPDQPAAAASTLQENSSGKAAAGTLSPLVTAVIKLADAEVSPEVIRSYVDASPSATALTEADVIALKQHKVGDELVTTLIKQGAKKHAQEVQAKNEAVVRALAARNVKSGGMDPESYDYFQYYYLHPRALASANQRLNSSYFGPGASAFYTFGPGFGWRPHGYGWPRY